MRFSCEAGVESILRRHKQSHVLEAGVQTVRTCTQEAELKQAVLVKSGHSGYPRFSGFEKFGFQKLLADIYPEKRLIRDIGYPKIRVQVRLFPNYPNKK